MFGVNPPAPWSGYLLAVLRSPVEPDYRRSHRMLLLLIVAHVLLMSLFPWIARLPGAAWDDMLEGWAWGKQFELEYNNPPPLAAWTAEICLHSSPQKNLSFSSLSPLNSGVTFAGFWLLSVFFLKKFARFPAVSLLLFAPS